MSIDGALVPLVNCGLVFKSKFLLFWEFYLVKFFALPKATILLQCGTYSHPLLYLSCDWTIEHVDAFHYNIYMYLYMDMYVALS